MAAGFEVTMSDLQSAAGQFRAEAGTFSGALPAGGPPAADGGSWVINDALSLVLQSVGLLHAQLTATVQGDAANLQATYAQYRAAEDKITSLVTAIATPDQAG
jgi:Family of unknown function (DUF6317)